ncbi:hypothetical protein X897_1545 [Burkholderia pseudomallei ABCPW 30]|nr:hypothetical protein BBS_3143 [Burkholderia pseudomallei NAU20B-16]AIV85018.1 hypothetical protein X978_675 [Burkholderia pseudomallei MSHR3965]AJX24101.1 hypothetical protein BG17_243 [Burkholderia pseudomallei MSHR491]AUG21051.1 hypothetical protein CXQ84_10725 [Burkholderia pseudomallei]EDU07294.1 conserved hypothetical protein [Burkholderia pseudomallei 1655]KGS23163.1 hypothetical protein X989_2829 [Burkholderia pseudomallei MSHR4378]KGS28840.1 hypothetical protein X941_751 [Burkholde
MSAGVCIFSVRALDAKQKEIVTSEQTQLPLKGGTADYLNIVWAVLANNLNGKPGHKEWIGKHGDNFNTRLAALRTARWHCGWCSIRRRVSEAIRCV